MSATVIRIVLELDAADHPSGTAAVEGGEPQPFEGWLELVVAIGALTGARADASPCKPVATTTLTEGDPR